MYRDYVCGPGNPNEVYVVERGDSLWRIAARELNNSWRWPEIASLNMLKEPYTILAGQRLYLPKQRQPATPFGRPPYMTGDSPKASAAPRTPPHRPN
jgi:LysM repeat protein